MNRPAKTFNPTLQDFHDYLQKLEDYCDYLETKYSYDEGYNDGYEIGYNFRLKEIYDT